MKIPGRPKREIEIKLRVDDVPTVIGKIDAIGATVEGRVLERNTLYDTVHGDLRRTGRLLRLRIDTPAGSKAIRAGKARALLTFKAPAPAAGRSRYKEKLESEVPIRDPERWARDLRALGFRPSFRYEKFRSTFTLPGVHICLDETPIGAFLELEGIPTAIDRAARRLGYGPQGYIRGTYWDLYAAACARRRQSPGNLLFSRVKIG
jgi:adenylate cyclase class 2